MARVQLSIDDPANRITLKTILEAEGHVVATERPDAIVADVPEKAIALSEQAPTLLLASSARVATAVAAMRKGVFGYLFVPFQPGEAGIMIERAIEWRGKRPSGAPAAAGPLEDAEARAILAALRQCRGNKTRTAALLGIGRNTLWRKLRKIDANRRAAISRG